MSKPHPLYSVNECKILASKLLKSLHSSNLIQVQKAAKRLQRLPEFSSTSIEAIISADIKRKHALTLIALEKGFKSWAELKCQLPFIRGGFLNKWFVNYEEAKSHHKKEGGFILPYQKQFMVCDENYIKNLGLNPADPDWQLIDYDWANPAHQEAGRRLYKKWMQIQEANHA